MGSKAKKAKQRTASQDYVRADKVKRKDYEAKLDELHMELVKMQYWMKATGKKLVILFEGRAAAATGATAVAATTMLAASSFSLKVNKGIGASPFAELDQSPKTYNTVAFR